jgi:hypothetical protein
VSVPLRRGSPNLVTLDAREAGKECIPACCILLSQPATSDVVWRVTISVKTENNRARLAVATLSNPAAGAAPSRVVALCYVPGAVAWDVTVDYVSGTLPAGATELIDIAASECCGGEFGATVLEGAVSPPIGATRSYSTLGGVSGVAAVPVGAAVVGIAAFANAGVANATIQVGGGPALPIPSGGTSELDPPFDPLTGQGTLRGPVNITFTNTGGYEIELVT